MVLVAYSDVQKMWHSSCKISIGTISRFFSMTVLGSMYCIDKLAVSLEKTDIIQIGAILYVTFQRLEKYKGISWWSSHYLVNFNGRHFAYPH